MSGDYKQLSKARKDLEIWIKDPVFLSEKGMDVVQAALDALQVGEEAIRRLVQIQDIIDPPEPHPRFTVWNRTDGIPATTCETREEAEQFIKEFPERYKAQGYYFTHKQERLAPEDVVLEIEDHG